MRTGIVQRRRGSRRPGRPSSRWGRRRERPPRPARRRSTRTAAGSRRCRPRRSAVSTPQWPWSVYSSRQRSAISTSCVADLARRDRAAPAGRCPADRRPTIPSRPCAPGTPNRISPPTPALAASDRRLAQRFAGVLNDAGHRADRRRLADAFLDEHRQHQLGRVEPHPGREPAQRRRPPQPARAAGREGRRHRLPRRAHLLRRPRGSATTFAPLAASSASCARRSSANCASAATSAGTFGSRDSTSTRSP